MYVGCSGDRLLDSAAHCLSIAFIHRLSRRVQVQRKLHHRERRRSILGVVARWFRDSNLIYKNCVCLQMRIASIYSGSFSMSLAKNLILRGKKNRMEN